MVLLLDPDLSLGVCMLLEVKQPFVAILENLHVNNDLNF